MQIRRRMGRLTTLMPMRIMRGMSIAHIRTKVFRMSQQAFADLAGVRQPTVSRWELGELHPNRESMRRIREAALAGCKPWDDRWFFEEPAE
jgi:DNA-binding transcriptional regulator YiaG